MKKYHIKYVSFLCLLFLLMACERNDDDRVVVSNINYVSFEPIVNFGVDPTGVATDQISIFSSTIINSDRSFNINIVEDDTTADPSSYSISSQTIVIPANSNEGFVELTVTGANVNPDGSVLTLEIVSQEGILLGDPLVINLSQVCPYPETFLDITFDDFPEEQSWEILDANDVVLFQGGPYPGEVTLNKALCLPPGSYKIVMNDVFGDGGGPYTLTYKEEVIVSRDGTHTFSETVPFQIN